MIRTPPARSRLIGAATLAALLGSAPSIAQTAPPSPIGVWNSGTVDSVTRLYVLDDHSYCFTLMAGNLDLISTGRWEKLGQFYRFTETKAPAPLFPMAARQSENSSGGRSLLLDGHMMSYADAPVIGFLKNRTDPLSLRRLFSRDNHSWSEGYDVPAAMLDGARYLVIGGRMDAPAEHYANDTASGPYQLYIYELGADATEYRLGYDRRQAMARLDFTADVGAGIMKTDEAGTLQRSTQPMDAKLADNVRRDCIDGMVEDRHHYLESRGIKQLVPLETRMVAAPAIHEDPVFEKFSVVEATDILEPLESTEIPAPLPPETVDKPAPSPGVDGLEQRFDAILRIKSTEKRVVAYDALWNTAINSHYDDQREVAARAAINLTNDLSSLKKYREAIKVSGDAYAQLIPSSDPVLRSRASSLLNNQATAWEGLKRPDQQEEVWRRIITDFANDSYPTTIYVRASTVLNMVDRLIVRSRKAEAAAMLDEFQRDYIESGRLAQRPEDSFAINCDADGGQFQSAVACMGSKNPDVAYFKKYVAAYRAKISSLK